MTKLLSNELWNGLWKKDGKQLQQAILRTQFDAFLEKSFVTLNPSESFAPNWHLEAISEYLNGCECGDIKRLIINVPPRSLKSVTVTVAWPAWLLAKRPSCKIIAASYSASLSVKHSLDTRALMESAWYRQLFPHVQLSTVQNEKHKFVTTEHGFRFATSVGGSVTGEGGDVLILDDPHNPAHIMSETQRKTTLDWYDQTFSSRLNNKKQGVIICVMQRLHEDDLTAHLLEKGGWECLSLPAVARNKTVISYGSFTKTRHKDEFLHAGRESAEEIAEAKRNLGSYAFAAQYQQDPQPQEGGMMQRSWLRYYSEAPTDGVIYQSWDTAIKTAKQHDYSVGTTWLVHDDSYFLLDVCIGKWEFPTLRRMIIQQAEKWQVAMVLLEDKASGQSLLQDLRRDMKTPLHGVLPRMDKVTRFAKITPLFESGRVKFPRYAPWLSDVESELLQFPTVAHDDQVDSISQFLNWIIDRGRGRPQARRL